MLAAGAVVFALLSTMVSAAQPAGRIVTFLGADGRQVTGLLVEAQVRPAPAVVLVPMLGRSRDDWQALAGGLADAGMHALSIDLPGTSLPGAPEVLAAWHEDVRAAVAYLAGQAGEVRGDAIGVAGASLGATLTVLAAAADPGVRSIALVSPSAEYRGVRIDGPLRQYGGRPALLVASLHDPYAARSVRELAHAGGGARQARWSEVTAHGTLLVARDPELVRALVEWFQLTLG